MKRVFLLVLASAFASNGAYAEIMNNENVAGLAEAGLGDDIIIAKIRASDASFELSTSDLMALKKKGVSDGVIAAMIDRSSAKDQSSESPESPDPMIAHPMGIYLLDDSATLPKMVKIDASGSSHMKIGNTLGYAFSYGISPITMKISINGDKAHVVTNSRTPVFYMFSAQSMKHPSSNPYAIISSIAFMSMQSPNDFSLVRLTPKSGHREAKVGNFNISGAQTGVMDKDRIQFEYTQIRNGVFKLKMLTPVPPGEYAFVKGMTAGSSIFDFSVR